jgi:hypothetical protein
MASQINENTFFYLNAPSLKWNKDNPTKYHSAQNEMLTTISKLCHLFKMTNQWALRKCFFSTTEMNHYDLAGNKWKNTRGQHGRTIE